jgi:pantothenate kinase type III
VELAEIDKDDQKNTMLEMEVTKLYDGKLKSTRTFEGFIITSVNRIKVTTVQSLLKQCKHKREIMIEGKYAGDPTLLLCSWYVK